MDGYTIMMLLDMKCHLSLEENKKSLHKMHNLITNHMLLFFVFCFWCFFSHVNCLCFSWKESYHKSLLNSGGTSGSERNRIEHSFLSFPFPNSFCMFGNSGWVTFLGSLNAVYRSNNLVPSLFGLNQGTLKISRLNSHPTYPLNYSLYKGCVCSSSVLLW